MQRRWTQPRTLPRRSSLLLPCGPAKAADAAAATDVRGVRSSAVPRAISGRSGCLAGRGHGAYTPRWRHPLVSLRRLHHHAGTPVVQQREEVLDRDGAIVVVVVRVDIKARLHGPISNDQVGDIPGGDWVLTSLRQRPFSCARVVSIQ